jgi:acyl-CoA synthetase (AMP-forming)/AMP-acid ligase II
MMYHLVPADALPPADVERVRRIYESSFAPHLRAEFRSLLDGRRPGELAFALTGPGEIRGEEVKAYYVAGDVTPQELAGYCRERLAGFKVPRFWQPEADLPRTDSERVVKSALGQLRGPVFDTVSGRWDRS